MIFNLYTITTPVDDAYNLNYIVGNEKITRLYTEHDVMYMTPELLENYLFTLTSYLTNMKNYQMDCKEIKYYLTSSHQDLQSFIQGVEYDHDYAINTDQGRCGNILESDHFKQFCTDTLNIDIAEYIQNERERLEIESFKKYNSAVNTLDGTQSDQDDESESFQKDVLRENLIDIIIQIKLIMLLLRNKVCKGGDLRIINLIKSINLLYNKSIKGGCLQPQDFVKIGNMRRIEMNDSASADEMKNMTVENSELSNNMSNFVGGQDIHNLNNKLSLAYISNNDSNNYYKEHDAPIYKKVDISSRTKPSDFEYTTQSLDDSNSQFLESSSGCLTRLSYKPAYIQTYDLDHIRQMRDHEKINLDRSSKMCHRNDYDYIDN